MPVLYPPSPEQATRLGGTSCPRTLSAPRTLDVLLVGFGVLAAQRITGWRGATRATPLTISRPSRIIPVRTMEDAELIAQQVSGLAEKLEALERKVAEVEKVNARLEAAALITARALEEIASHWDAVYEAMRRPEEP